MGKPEVSIIVPTFMERDNIAPLVERVRKALDETVWEMIIVDDDSPDGTAEHVKTLSYTEPRLLCIHRIGRRGLASACTEGVLASSAPVVAVMDADLQHPPETLPDLLAAIRDGADIAVASRSLSGADFGKMSSKRQSVSRFASWLSRVVLRVPLGDPMSGFFMMRRELFMRLVRGLSAIGFKILLDIAATAPKTVRVVEVPYVFRDRAAGDSKLDFNAAWGFLVLLLDKTLGHWFPLRFMIFCIVGGLGAVVHFLVLGTLHLGFQAAFIESQAIATSVAILFNFTLNNILTFRDRRKHGWPMLASLFKFIAVSSVGAAANIGVAGFMFTSEGVNWSISAMAGIVIGAVWNFALSQVYVWSGSERQPVRSV